MEFYSGINSSFEPIFTPENLELFLNLNTKKIPLKDSGIPARVFNYWKKRGMCGSNERSGGKRKWEILSFIEFIWLKSIEEMRIFGVHFERIKEAKDFLLSDIDREVLREEFRNQMEQKKPTPFKEQISEMIQEINSSDLSKEEKEKIISSLQNIDLLMDEAAKKLNLNFFGMCLISSILHRQEFGLIIKKDKVTPFLYEMLKSDKENKLKEFLFESHVYISITKLYFQFLNDETKLKYASTYSLLNENENQILSFLKQEDFREINIKRDSKNTVLTGKKKFPYDVETYHEWKKKTKLRYPFCEITEKQHEGKISSIEFTVKEIIKK